MSRSRLAPAAIIVAALVIIIALLSNNPARTAADSATECIELYVGGDLVFQSDACNAPAPTATPPPTSTNAPPPTETPAPTATSTPPPTATPPDPGNGEPDPDDPLCETHDDRAWHGLHDAERDCHYDHAHGVALGSWAYDLFGPEIAQVGEVISYGWQTPRENELKHQGYVVHGRDIREYGCHSNTRNTSGSVNAFAFQLHGVGMSHGKLARFHSFYAALNLCDENGDAGQVITGGQADFGQLISPYKRNFVSTPRFPEQRYDVGLPPYVGEPDPVRSSTRQETWNSITRGDSRPHAAYHNIVGYAFRIQDAMDYVREDTRSSGDPVFVPFNEPGGNSSAYQVYQIEVHVPDLNGDGSRVNFEGTTDVQGNITENCSPCVPLVIRNAVPGAYTVNITNDPLASLLDIDTFSKGFYDHDIYFDGQPSGWIDLSRFGQNELLLTEE